MDTQAAVRDFAPLEEAAEITGYHPDVLRKLIKAGEISARKIPGFGKRLMIMRCELDGLRERRANQKRGRPKGNAGA